MSIEPVVFKKGELRQAAALQLCWFMINGLIILSQQFTFPDREITDFLHFLYFLSGRLLLVPLILYLGTIQGQRSFADLGLTLKNFGQNIKLALKLSLPLLVMVMLFINLPYSLELLEGEALNPLFTLSTPGSLTRSLLYLLPVTMITLLPALADELLFRGFLLPLFLSRFGVYFGIILNALYYAFIFFEFQREILIINLCVGLICAHLFYRTGSIITSTLFQALYHAIFILYLFGFHYW